MAFNVKSEWYAAIFKEEELVASKEFLDYLPTKLNPAHQFFCINPVSHVDTKGAFVEAYRNILIEFDKTSINEQIKYVNGLEMPFTVCTFSGGKSLHFIISLKEALKDAKEYGEYVSMIYAGVAGKLDTSCKNPSRLSRTPNATRKQAYSYEEPPVPVLQKLIKVQKSVDNEELLSWLFSGKVGKRVNKFLKEQQALTANRLPLPDGERPPLPTIYQNVLTGALHPDTNSRHASLTKFAVWLANKGYSEEELTAYLLTAEEAYGLTHRKDVEGILKWLSTQAF